MWSTKQRLPLIESDFEQALYDKIREKAVELEGLVHAIGGIENHMHLAVSVPPKIALAEFIGQVKGFSAHFMHQETGNYFGWQAEYGIVSFGSRNLDMVVKYILNQRQHHAENSIIPAMELERDSTKIIKTRP